MSGHPCIQKLLSDLDSNSRKTQRQAEHALAAMGEDAVEAVLKSAHEINLQLIPGYQADSVLHSLERHIRLLGLIGSNRGVQMISAAVADTSELIFTQHKIIQQMKSATIPDPTSIVIARKRLSLAKRVRRTAVKALVQIGDEAEHQLSAYMNAFSPVAQSALRRALRSIRFRRFLRKLLGRH